MKASAAYTLPYDFQVSGTFIAVPGVSVDANYSVIQGFADIFNVLNAGTVIRVNERTAATRRPTRGGHR